MSDTENETANAQKKGRSMGSRLLAKCKIRVNIRVSADLRTILIAAHLLANLPLPPTGSGLEIEATISVPLA
jgi:hypothetical protein